MSDANREKLLARFWAKVNKTETCWLWTGGKRPSGKAHYGTICVNGVTRSAHRVAYEALVGPIPLGFEIDHVRSRGCDSTLCVRPEHLEPVTPSENHLRRVGDSCVHGHPFAGSNLHVDADGFRRCRTCKADTSRRLRAKRKCANSSDKEAPRG